jgi:hypothetical protein
MDDYHKTVREAVAAKIVAVFAAADPVITVDVYEQDVLTPNVIMHPAIVVSYDPGGERVIGRLNASDYIAYPLLVSYLTNRPDLGSDPPGGPTTGIRQVLRQTFDQKRPLTTLTDVYVCEYDGNPPTVDEQPFEQLRTQVRITAFARITR